FVSFLLATSPGIAWGHGHCGGGHGGFGHGGGARGGAVYVAPALLTPGAAYGPGGFLSSSSSWLSGSGLFGRPGLLNSLTGSPGGIPRPWSGSALAVDTPKPD